MSRKRTVGLVAVLAMLGGCDFTSRPSLPNGLTGPGGTYDAGVPATDTSGGGMHDDAGTSPYNGSDGNTGLTTDAPSIDVPPGAADGGISATDAAATPPMIDGSVCPADGATADGSTACDGGSTEAGVPDGAIVPDAVAPADAVDVVPAAD